MRPIKRAVPVETDHLRAGILAKYSGRASFFSHPGGKERSTAPGVMTGISVLETGEPFAGVRFVKAIVPARSCDQTGTKWGVGVRHTLFPMLALGARWLPASRRYSPRQAESSAS